MTDTLPLLFQQFFEQAQLAPSSTRVLLAMSGGVDSVVLGHLLHRSGIAFSMAHANFQLRDAESERDEDFVRQLAADWQVPLHVKRFDTAEYATTHKCSKQVAARQLRYAWFEELATQEGALIATAHHADDSAETLLHHLFRGTGIAGLRGILPRQGRLIRPLVYARKADVLDYARQHALAWVEDSSNASDDYTRNAIRHSIMPAVEQVFPQAVPQLQQTAQHLYEAAMLYEQAVQQQLRKLVKQQGSEQRVPVLALLKASPRNTIVWEWIKPLHFAPAQVPEVLKLCRARSGAMLENDHWRLLRHRRWLIAMPRGEQAAHSTYVLTTPAGNLHTPDGQLRWHTEAMSGKDIPNLPAHEAWLDADELQWPLVLRRRKAGDYLYPLGMQKKKKLSRVLIDLRLSVADKGKIWVLESALRIAWVPGIRIDDRCKLTAATRQVLRLHWTPA